MRIFKLTLAVPVLAALLAIGDGRVTGASDRSPEEAYRSSIAAMKARDFKDAIPDLKYAADHGVFLAQYYLARLYAVDGEPFSDRAAAFSLLRALVAAHGGADPFTDKHALFVADAERMLSHYYRHGVPEAGVAPDPARARGHLEHAGMVFGNLEAQFELALLDLQTPELGSRGLDTLDMLAETKHNAAAAAQIALIYNEGRLRPKSPVVALAYARFALNLAKPEDQIWISDIYQTLYCKAEPAERTVALALAADLEKSAMDGTDGDRPSAENGAEDPPDLTASAARWECSGGDAVPLPPGLKRATAQQGAPPAIASRNPGKGFNSLVGYIAPAVGGSLKDLETPTESLDQTMPTQ